MPLIPFPNIPALPGVPPLPRSIANLENDITLLAADEAGLLGMLEAPRWGIYDEGGALVAEADSVVNFEHGKEWRISDFPVEEGSFASYNKVETPFDQRVLFAKGGGDAERSDFLNSIDEAVSSLDLYSVVTPDATYVNANLVRYEYRRTSRNGVTLLLVEVVVREVRVAASAAFSDTASPSGADPISGGTVQPQTPSADQVQAASGGAG